jgi:uncharacterized protein (DUF2249 family)
MILILLILGMLCSVAVLLKFFWMKIHISRMERAEKFYIKFSKYAIDLMKDPDVDDSVKNYIEFLCRLADRPDASKLIYEAITEPTPQGSNAIISNHIPPHLIATFALTIMSFMLACSYMGPFIYGRPLRRRVLQIFSSEFPERAAEPIARHAHDYGGHDDKALALCA